jgi:serine/threonine-protein kinase
VGGRYVVERRLGAGGVGEVWAGKPLDGGASVAIKTLLPAAAVEREMVARFRREAQFLARVSSQYVARVIDFLSDEKQGLVLVLELVDGEALSEVLQSGKLSVEQGIEVAWDVMGGVADLHREQIVHRDLKPGNVILRQNPAGGTHAVIVDFGMSRFTGLDKDGEEITALTSADIAVGTIEYMAPEQILNSRGVTGAADIYAVGAMLYRAVAGEHVFPEFEDRALLARHKLICDPRPLETGRGDGLARAFEAIVNRMLCRMPAQRYARAEEVLAELAALRGGERASLPLASEPSLAAPSAADNAVSVTVRMPVELMPDAPAEHEGGVGRWLRIAGGVLLVTAAAAVVGLSLHRRGQVTEEVSGVVPLDDKSLEERDEPAVTSVGAASAPAAQVDLAASSDAEAAEPGADPSQAARAESTAGLSPAAPAKRLARGPSDPSKVPAEPARSPEKPRAALAPKPVAAKPAAAAPKTAKPAEAKPVEAKPDAPGSGTPKPGQAPPTPLETP